jgi:hypothetical protein
MSDKYKECKVQQLVKAQWILYPSKKKRRKIIYLLGDWISHSYYDAVTDGDRSIKYGRLRFNPLLNYYIKLL